MAANFTPTIGASGRGVSFAEAKDSLFSLVNPESRGSYLTLLTLVSVLTLAYWRTLTDTAVVWSQPQYSHGWIIPLIALYVLWCRRPDPTERSEFTPMLGAVAAAGIGLVAAGFFAGVEWLQGAGLAVIVVGVLAIGLLHQPFSPAKDARSVNLQSPTERVLLGGSLAATLMVAASLSGVLTNSYRLPLMLVSLVVFGGVLIGVSLTARSGPLSRTGSETWASTLAIVGASLVWVQASLVDMMPLIRLSLLVSLLGVFGIVGGRRLLQWAGPSVVFLIFMFPLPSVAEHRLLPLLQKLATIASTTVLQLIGLPAFRDGNNIRGLDIPLDVAEACSGLRMSTIFAAMTIAMVFLIRRPWWDKLTVLLSAIPVALLANVIRIVITALIYHSIPDNSGVHKAVHDWAGIAMMPLALGILWLELTILSNLTVIEEANYKPSGGAPLARV